MITFEPLYATLKRKSMNIGDLASAMGISRTSLRRILNSKNASVIHIEEICNAINCSIDEVVRDNGQYEACWESILNEIDERRNPGCKRIERYMQEHPWLKELDYRTAGKVLLIT